jgi:hypothetical protein
MKTLLLALSLLTATATAQVSATTTLYGPGSGGLAIHSFGGMTPVMGSTIRTVITGQRPLYPSSPPNQDITYSFLMFGFYKIPANAGGNSLGGVMNPLLLQSVDVIIGNVSTGPIDEGGTSQVAFDVPVIPELAGTHLYLQVGNFSPYANPGATTWDSLLLSNGIDWMFGNN